MTSLDSLSSLSDHALIATTIELIAHERGATARVLAALGELDVRRLYLGEGCSSLFAYCTRILHLSEHAAYNRIDVARSARRFPIVLEMIADGSVTVTNVRLLCPHFTEENHQGLLTAAKHKSRAEVERQVAAIRPLPPVASTVRKLPQRKALAPTDPAADAPIGPASRLPPPDVSVAPSKPAVVQPLAPERYRLQFTISGETHAKLGRVKDLTRHSIPSGDVAIIFDRALTLLLAKIERTKLGATAHPRESRAVNSGSRRIPASVRRAVWTRDGGRCAFVGTHGRCEERSFLEFHHVVPFAVGGAATVEKIELRCRAHNAYDAALFFGPSAEWVREDPAVYA